MSALDGGRRSKALASFATGNEIGPFIDDLVAGIDVALVAGGFDGGALEPDEWHWAMLTVRAGTTEVFRNWTLGVQFVRRTAGGPIEARVRSYEADGLTPREDVLDELLVRLGPAVAAAAPPPPGIG
jgi:hypothetical protein